MKLRYTGPIATTFITARVGVVEPGGEFEVPDEMAEQFTRRPDIEQVAEQTKTTASKAKSADGPSEA